MSDYSKKNENRQAAKKVIQAQGSKAVRMAQEARSSRRLTFTNAHYHVAGAFGSLSREDFNFLAYGTTAKER
jgi:hypothetical protein